MLDFVTDYIKFGKKIYVREKYSKGFVDIRDDDYIPIHALKNISSDRNSYEDISEELDHNWRVFLKHNVKDLKGVFYGYCDGAYDHKYEVNIYVEQIYYKLDCSFGNVWDRKNGLLLQICVNKQFVNGLFEKKCIDKKFIEENTFLFVKKNLQDNDNYKILKRILKDWDKENIKTF